MTSTAARRVYVVGVAACVALALTAAAGAAAPVSGSVSGPIVSLSGKTFTLTTSLSPTGKSKITVGSATVVSEQVAVSRSDLTTGVCVSAIGSKSGSTVMASRITISRPVKGKCGGGFGRGGGNRPAGSRPGGTRPPGGGAGGFRGGNFGFAFGAISAIKGSTLTVHSKLRGNTTVSVSSRTTFSETRSVGASAIAVKLCAFVRGTSTDRGVTVTAQNVALTRPGPTGCSFGFPRGG